MSRAENFTQSVNKILRKCLNYEALPSQIRSLYVQNENAYAQAVMFLSILTTAFALTLRKHAYSNILKISPPKTESF